MFRRIIALFRRTNQQVTITTGSIDHRRIAEELAADAAQRRATEKDAPTDPET